MSTEAALYILVVAAIVLFFLVVYRFAIYRARYLTQFLQDYGTETDVDPYFWEYDDTVIYFQRAALSGKYEIDEDGIFLHAFDQFNTRLPWEKIAAIRFLDFNGTKVANLRLITPDGVERRLSFEWKDKPTDSIPDTVSVIWT